MMKDMIIASDSVNVQQKSQYFASITINSFLNVSGEGAEPLSAGRHPAQIDKIVWIVLAFHAAQLVDVSAKTDCQRNL